MNHPVALGKSTSVPTIQKSCSRVLNLINGEHFSGAERVQDLLAVSLQEFDYEVGFACFKQGRFADERQAKDNELFELNVRSRFDIRAVRKLRKLVIDNNYDILHAHTPRTLLAGSMISESTGCPLVYHVHSPAGRDSTRSWRNRVNQWVESWAARRVDHFICVSDNIREYMIGLGHDDSCLSTVPNGVAVIDAVPDRPTPNGMWTLGTTALFRPRKGTEILLQALAILKERGRNVQLLAVGPFESTDYEQRIKSLAYDLAVDDMIEWTGFTSDVNSHFQKMDAFVLPSLFGEGLPMVVLEAMAGGIPVVAARVEGVTQAIRDGIDGLVFEPASDVQLAERVEELMDGCQNWQAIRNSALDRQRELFSDRSMARGVSEIYQRVCQEFTARGNSSAS